jgi:cytochrome oxidase Cu insertion factor (SCO1/SenC/PrrC family)
MKRILVALFLVACATGKSDGTNDTNKPTEAKTSAVSAAPMPAFSLNRVEGGTFASTELAGKAAMVNFWHPS